MLDPSQAAEKHSLKEEGKRIKDKGKTPGFPSAFFLLP
jgi:hypothetical protein